MSKRRFLVKGGKGKIGLGARQISGSDIIHIYEDNVDDFTKVNESLKYVTGICNLNLNLINYNRLFYREMLKDDFSERFSLFGSNEYCIVKNSKDEFFFGINSKRPNSRLDPRGTIVKVINNNSYQNKRFVDIYILANEKPIYEKDQLTFYKAYSNYNINLYNRASYDFSIIREDIPPIQNNDDTHVDLKRAIILKEDSPNSVTKIWSGTQQQYNSITTKDTDVLYFVIEE